MPHLATSARQRPLGDTPMRDYAAKLALFNAFAAPELLAAIDALDLRPGMRVLDAGCGTSNSMPFFQKRVGAQGLAVGVDLSWPHVIHGSRSHPSLSFVQADITATPFAAASFDLVWSVNAINHVAHPVQCLRQLAESLRPGGRLVLAQSCFLPDMIFAWDARLERVVNEAVREYYRLRYGLDEQSLTGVRGLVGQLRAAGLYDVTAKTVTIERISPLREVATQYFIDAVFRDTCGERLKPHLSPDDYRTLQRLCDPNDSQFALRRDDFHFIQTLSFVSGRVSS